MDAYTNGNEFYKKGDCENAIREYSCGVQQLIEKDELYAKLLLNRAQCFLKKECYSEASKDCSLVINSFTYVEIDNSTQQLVLKAYLRRAQAHELLGNYSKALRDVDHALTLDPPVSLRKTALVARSKLRGFVDVDHKVSLSEGRPKMMVTDQQALRLGFIEQPPEIFTFGESYLIRLCITNELGLWDRDFIRRSFQLSDNHSGVLESIADIQCSMSLFNLAEGSESNGDKLGGVLMEMRTCHSTSNSSPLSIGEDGKV